MQKFYLKRCSLSFLFLLVVLCLIGTQRLQAQTTETFEGYANGSPSFTSNGQVFNITTDIPSLPWAVFDVFSDPLQLGLGWNGTSADNKFVDNSGGTFLEPNCKVGVTVNFSIATQGATPIQVKSFWLYLSKTNLTFGPGSVTITGSLNGSTRFTATASSGFNTNLGVANGFTLIDLATFGGSNNASKNIDKITISTGGNFEYVALDAFKWSSAGGPPASTTVTSVTVPLNKTYKIGNVLNFTANLSANVTVTGTPQLGLTIGGVSRVANYAGGSGTSALTFSYAVVSGDLDGDGIAVGALGLNGGTIKTGAIDAVLTLNNIGSTTGVLVDGVLPTLSAVTIASNHTNNNKARVGSGVTLAFTSSEAIATPVVSIAGHSVTATNTSGNNWTSTYTMVSGDTEGIIPFSIAFNDVAGNAGTAVTATTNSSTVTFDKTAPTAIITSDAGVSGSTTTLATVNVTVKFSEPVTGFTLIDLIPSNGTIYAFSGSGDTYTIKMDPASAGNFGVTLPANNVQDLAGNNNTASAPYVLIYGPTPVINTTGVISAMLATYGSPSNTSSISVSGTNISGGGITATASTGFEVSKDNTSYASSVILSGTGSVSGTIYTRIKVGTTAGTYTTGNIQLTSGATTQNVSIPTATVSPAPLTITANNANKIYGQILTGGSGSTDFTSTGLVSSETIGSVTIAYGTGASASDNAGTYVTQVTPSAAIGGTFNPSNYTITYAKGNIIVGKATATIALSNLAQTYDATAKTASATTVPAGLSGINFTYDGSATAPVAAGSYAVVASLTNANYTAVNATGNLVIGKAAQTINFTSLTPKTYGDAPFALSATGGGSGNAVTYISSNTAVATVSGNTVTIVGVGNTTITASQAGNANYNAATDVPQTLTVSKATATIALSNLAQTYDATAKTASATTVPAGLSGISITYDGSATAPVAAGSYAVVASLTNANYTAVNATGNLVIGKAAQTINFTSLTTKTYGDAPFALSATGGGSGNAVTYISSNTAVATVSGNTVTIVGAGNTTITASQSGNANYNAATDVPQTLTVGKATATIALSNLAQTYDATAKAASATTVPAGLSGISITYDGSATAPIAAGSYAVVASLTNANYSAVNATGTLVISKTTQTINFTALTTKTYGDAPFALNATGGGSGNAVTYISSNTAVATVSGNTVTIVGVGNTTITASQAGNANYNAATDVPQTLTVGKATATIALSNLGQTYDATAKTASATTVPAGLSGISITYDGSATAPIAAGSYAVVASLTNANYSAVNATGTLVISKTTQTINFTALATKTYGDAPFALSATGGGSGNVVTYISSNTAVATISGNTVTIVGAGNTTITASQAGNANYNAATDVPQTLTVGKATATIALSNLAQTYDATAKTASATAVPAGLSGISITYDGSATAPIAAGSYAVLASLTNANFIAVNATGNLVIGKAAQTINFTALTTKTYGDAPFSLSATGGGSGNAVTYISSNTAVATVSGNTVTIVGAGNTTITASQSGNANYNAATDVPQTLTVGKATATIALSNLAQTYDATAKAASATTVPAGLSGISITYDGSATAPIAAGSYAVVASLTNANYTAVNATGNLVIGKAAQTINFTALTTKTYGDAPFALNATGGGSGNAVTYISSNTAVATVSGSTVTIVGAGNTTITASQAGNANYDPATDVPQTLTVGKATATIALSNLAQTYDATAKTASATTVPAGLSGISVTYDGSATAPVAAGSYAVVASLTNANYTAVNATGTLVISKTTQTINFTALASKTYGDAPFALTATGGASGNAISYTSSNTAVATISGNTVTIVGAGTTTITANQLGNVNYSAAGAVTQGLTIIPKPITGAFVAADKAYDGNTNATISAQTLAGVLTADLAAVTLTGGTASFADANVGAGKSVTANGMALAGTRSGNYSLTSVASTTAAINPKAITVIAEAKTKTYGDPDPALTYTIPAGSLIGTDVVSGSLTRNAGSGAGTYAITLGTVAASSNYSINYVGAALTINKKLLTITADNKTKLFNTANPALTVSYSGFVNAENSSTLTTQPTIATSATVASPAGSYPIIPGAAVAGNYDFAYVNGVLTITSTSQVITFAALTDKLSTDAPFTLGATSSSGLTLTYTSSDVSIARIINGNQVEILKAGIVNITASQAGNLNYTAAVPVVQSLKIIDNPAPIIAITSDRGLNISKGETARLTATGAVTYQWATANGIVSGESGPVLTIRPSVTTTYTVTGANQYGRTSSQTFTMEVRDDFQAVEATNILTPNGDGVNDKWLVYNIDQYPNSDVKIFDRAGRVLYSRKGYDNSWDGIVNGQALNEGTYYYIIDFGAGKLKKKGYITVIRGGK
jgi:gliding motility-associated-like protein